MKKSKDVSLVDTSTGETFSFLEINKKNKSLHDSSKFTKLFEEGLDFLMSCKLCTIKLSLYIMKKMTPSSDLVNIKRRDVITYESSLSGSGFYNAIIELVEGGVIAKNKKDTYFVNQNLFFNGDRRKKYNNDSKAGRKNGVTSGSKEI